MNIDDYRYITTIADLGSFTSAAKELFIAQPSLSQRVKYIEDTYGISIFIRDTKGIRLTAEGECFVRYARQILNLENDLQKEISDLQGRRGNDLRIGTSQLIISPFFDSLIRNFHEKYPDIHFEFIEQTSPSLQQLLLLGNIDIAFCYLPITSSELKYEIIYTDRFVLVPAKGSALSAKISAQTTGPASYVKIDLIDNEPFAIGRQGSRLHQYFMSILEGSQVKPDIQHISKNFSRLYAFAKEGIASTILLESFFDPTQEHEPYYYIESSSDNELPLAITWRKGAYLSQAAKKLISFAHDFNLENN